MSRKLFYLFGYVLVLSMVLVGCQRPHVPKPGVAPKIKHCFDTVGHIPGAKPWLLGGDCCCTPSEQVVSDWQKNGYFVGKSVSEIIDQYKAAGICLATDHVDCNNACEHGPHVVKGGKCMVPPTPGTENYEEVLYGCQYMERNEAPQKCRNNNKPDQNTAYTLVEVEQE